MVGPAMDCVRNPLGAVRILFQRTCDTGTVPADLSKSDWGVRDLFQRCLYEEGGLAKVPEVNAVPIDSIPANSLVRFRGMIQDMFDTEYYVGAYKVGSSWHTGKFTDTADVHPEAETALWDRRLLYVVPIPGENSWVKEAVAVNPSTHPSNDSAQNREKRSRDSSAEDGPVDMESDTLSDCSAERKKRVMREEGRRLSSNDARKPVDLNMPIPEPKLFTCLVKVYDGADADLKLNDIVEFVGVVTFDPLLSTNAFIAQGDTEEDTEDNLVSHLPASKVPRLHCFTWRKLHGHNFMLSLPSMAPPMSTLLAAPPSNVAEVRCSLLQGLTRSFGGDRLVGEYFLLHMLSQVHTRKDDLALGKLSLNITGCQVAAADLSPSLAAVAAKAVAFLLPRSHTMSLTLELLNAASFSPSKDYESNRLLAGPLQLAEGTHLTIDETALLAGKLTGIGVQNVTGLKRLMQSQKVEYDFKYYKMEMPADVPVLVTSQAKAKLLPADAVIPLKSTASLCHLVGNDEDISKWRLYLNYVRGLSYSIDPGMQQIVEGDLVSARQEDRSLGPDDFHRWLTMGRLMSLSYGETTLSADKWHSVKDLERRLAERVRCC